jgi:hypothetical protein
MRDLIVTAPIVVRPAVERSRKRGNRSVGYSTAGTFAPRRTPAAGGAFASQARARSRVRP